MNVATQVLLVEDDGEIRGFVRAALEREGFGVCEAANAQRGRDRGRHAQTRSPDSGSRPPRPGWRRPHPRSPRMDPRTDPRAVGACRRIREDRGAQCRRRRLSDQAVRHRRTHRPRTCDIATRRKRPWTRSPVCEFGMVRVDMANHTVTRDGVPVHLTPVEMRLLGHLVARPGTDDHASATPQRGLGTCPSRRQPLPAHLHGAPATEAGGGSGAAASFDHRNRGRLPLRTMTGSLPAVSGTATTRWRGIASPLERLLSGELADVRSWPRSVGRWQRQSGAGYWITLRLLERNRLRAHHT